MEAKTIVPWVFAFVLFILLIIFIVLYITKKCTEAECPICPTGPEYDPENPICPTGCNKDPEYICIINDPQNTQFQNKLIKFGFSGEDFYLTIFNGQIAFTNVPNNNDLWSYNGNTLTHNNNGGSLRYIGVNENNETGYFLNGYIQLYPSDGHYYENWDFDGYNFYLRILTTNSTRYMLTSSIPFTNRDILTITPISNYMVGRNMNDLQTLIVVN